MEKKPSTQARQPAAPAALVVESYTPLTSGWLWARSHTGSCLLGQISGSGPQGAVSASGPAGQILLKKLHSTDIGVTHVGGRNQKMWLCATLQICLGRASRMARAAVRENAELETRVAKWC
eukprot:COSAG01_NODE_1863_length_9037_cov_37.811591_7_plen_121_part_00